VIKDLSKMSRQEKDAWEQKIGLKSARYEFSILFDEYEKLTSKEEFLKFKSKYANQLMFNEMDVTDCSIDYPFASTFFSPVLNNKGVFKVGLSLFKFTKENQIIILDGDMNKLENLSSYANDNTIIISSKLKSGGRKDADEIIDNFGNWNTSGDRRLLNELRIAYWVIWNQPVVGGTTFVTKGYNFYLRQRCQKNTLFGWSNYSTTYVFNNIFCKVRSLPTANWSFGISPEVNPYYDWLLYNYQIDLTVSGGADLNYLVRPLVSMQGDVSCRGFNGVPYTIIHREHSIFP